MVQVINDPNRQTYGQTLSKSLSSALEGLASHKIGQMQAKHQQTRTAQSLESLLGVSSKEAHNLALLDPKILEHVVKNKLAAPSEEAFAQALGLGGPSQSPQTAQPESEGNELLKYIPEFLESEEGQKTFTPEQRQEIMQKMTSQQTQPQTQPQGQQKASPRLKADQAFKLAQLGEAKQQNINQENKPTIERITQAAEPKRILRSEAKEALRLFNLRDEKGNRIAQVGTIKGLTPSSFQNDVTQALVAKLNDIVIKKSESGKGVPHRARLALERLSKADVWQKPAAVEYLLKDIISDTTEGLYEDEARRQIMEEHNNIQPRGLETLIEKREKLMSGLPDPDEYSDDAAIKYKGYEWEKSGDSWKYVGPYKAGK